MEWIVFDYAGVISLPPPDHAGALLPYTLSASPEKFWPAYWALRPAYDLGAVSAAAFWQGVGARLDRRVDDDLLSVLGELDLRAWGHVNLETVEVLNELAESGAALALLSNAPVELARQIDRQSWAGLFTHRFFSADLGLVKPDPRIFQTVCEVLKVEPEEVFFVDDREENIAAARRQGMPVRLFTEAADLRGNLPYLQSALR
jgi:putative hydrolase of the HAD superfamily